MSFSLSVETQKLIEQRMKERGVATPDELVRVALQTLDQAIGEPFEALDLDTQAAIEEGLSEAGRDEGVPWEEMRETVAARFVRKK